jgi:aminoglycoside phosphotransferase (APT) family kinase protein
MDLVTGIVPVQWRGDDPEVFPDAARRRSIGWQFTDTLAAIHSVDWEAAGLDDLLPGTGAVDPGTAEIDRWERFLDDSVIGDVPVLRAGIGWCRRNVAVSGRRVLCHGDYRIGNFMVRDGRIVAVFDWELAHIGDPREDLGWCMMASVTQPPDIVGADEQAFYERYREVSGLNEEQVNPATTDYFLLLSSSTVFVSVLEQLAGLAEGQSAGIQVAYMSPAVAGMHDVFLRALKRHAATTGGGW